MNETILNIFTWTGAIAITATLLTFSIALIYGAAATMLRHISANWRVCHYVVLAAALIARKKNRRTFKLKATRDKAFCYELKKENYKLKVELRGKMFMTQQADKQNDD